MRVITTLIMGLPSILNLKVNPQTPNPPPGRRHCRNNTMPSHTTLRPGDYQSEACAVLGYLEFLEFLVFTRLLRVDLDQICECLSIGGMAEVFAKVYHVSHTMPGYVLRICVVDDCPCAINDRSHLHRGAGGRVAMGDAALRVIGLFT